jgi:hypothetical protein
MLILCAIIGCLLCLTCFFFLVIHPLVCIVQCAISQNLSGGQKALWIFLSFFLGIIGSLPYALLASGSSRIRSMTLNGMKLGAVNLLLAIGVFVATPEIRNSFNVPTGETTMDSMFAETSLMAETSDTMSTIHVEEPAASLQTEPARLIRAIEPTSNPENSIEPSVVAEIASELENKTDLWYSLEDLGEDTDKSELVADSAGTPDMSQNNSPEQSVVENTTLESAITTETSVSSEALDDLLSTREPVEKQTPVVVPEQEERLDSVLTDNTVPTETTLLTEPKEMTESKEMTETKEMAKPKALAKATVLGKPENSAKNQPINRYREEGYAVQVRTVPPTQTVRNRYTNQ